MTDYTREQIEEMLAGTTPGPWQADGTSVFVDTRRQVCCGKGQYECCGEPDIEGDYESIADAHPANARLIAAAPDLARQCLVTLDRVEALEGRWKPCTMPHVAKQALLNAFAETAARRILGPRWT